jgi:cytochrome c-type biogenesis protein CcmH/NrfG
MAAEALSVSRAAVEIHPGASRLWVILGQVNYRIITEFGPWPESIAESRAAFERASELEPHQPWPWLEWARLERGLGNLDESAILVRRALEAEPHALRASLFLARVELDRGNVSSAREALDSARASFELRKRPGLKTYERELLAVPMWQFREIEEALN